MPGSIRGAVSNGTFPTSLSTKFVRAQSVQARVNEYHDGTTQRSALVDESRRTWQLAKRLTATDLATLRDFWQANPNTAFTFYDPFETVPPFTQNPTTTDGAYLVRFNSDWNETIGMVRSDAGVELIEMTASTTLSSTTIVVASTPGSGKVLYLGTDAEPSAWMNTGFDDSAWNAPVLQTATTEGSALEGSSWITNEATNDLDPGDQALYRIPFTVAGDVLACSIQIAVDNFLTGLWVNGTAITYAKPATWPSISPAAFTAAASISPSLINSGDNLLAIAILNDQERAGSNPLSLSFLLTITTKVSS